MLHRKSLISLTSIFSKLFILIFIFNFLSFLFINNTFETSDIDSEIYFGQRLLNGELIYLKEFHDKFPLVQYLFSIPAYFGSVRIWIIFSSISIIFTSYHLYQYLFNYLFVDWGLKDTKVFKKIVFLLSTFFLYCSSVLDDSLLHINSFAANLSLISTIFLIRSSSIKIKNNYKNEFLLSSLTSAISISIRPYFLPVTIISVFWIEIRRQIILKRIINFRTFIEILYKAITWLLSIFICGILLNSLPYIFIGKFKSFVEGVILIGSKINQSSIKDNLISQFNEYIRSGNITSLLLFAILLGLISFSFSYINKSEKNITIRETTNLDLMFGSVLTLVILEITLLTKHFWDHYFILFIPYLVFSISLSSIYIWHNRNQLFYNSKFYLSEFQKIIIIISILTILIKPEIRSSLKNASDIFKDHFQQKELELVSNYLKQREEKDLSTNFFYPDSMFIHWKLRESRHGFPNEGIVNHIKLGWWENLKVDKLTKSPKNKQEYCSKLREIQDTILFTTKNSFEYECLKTNNKFSIELVDEKSNLYSIFKESLGYPK